MLKKCRCGRYPKFENRSRVFGHGDCPTVWYLACDCGLQTKEVAEGYEGNEDQCKTKAMDIWNGDVC